MEEEFPAVLVCEVITNAAFDARLVPTSAALNEWESFCCRIAQETQLLGRLERLTATSTDALIILVRCIQPGSNMLVGVSAVSPCAEGYVWNVRHTFVVVREYVAQLSEIFVQMHTTISQVIETKGQAPGTDGREPFSLTIQFSSEPSPVVTTSLNRQRARPVPGAPFEFIQRYNHTATVFVLNDYRKRR